DPGHTLSATPHAIKGRWISRFWCILREPFFHGDRRANAHFRHDLEFIHQQLRARQANAQSFPRRITVLHGLRDLSNTGALVARYHTESLPGTKLDGLENDLPAPGIFDNI